MTTARDYLGSVLSSVKAAEQEILGMGDPDYRARAVLTLSTKLQDIACEVQHAIDSINKASAEL